MSAIVSAITDVFGEIGTWIVSMISQFTSIFYTTGTGGAGEFTFIGVLALCSLGIGIIWMLIGFVYKFIKFKN